jgi:hypothetical protein
MFKVGVQIFFHLRRKQKCDKYEKNSNLIRQVVQITGQKLMQL